MLRVTQEYDREESEHNTRKILVISLDFDGCLANPKFMEALKKRIDFIKENKKDYFAEPPVNILDYNQQLIDFLANLIIEGNYTEVYFTSFSNRQSFDKDLNNRFKPYRTFQTDTGSSFSQLRIVCNQVAEVVQEKDSTKKPVPISVDEFLMADPSDPTRFGESFRMAEEQEEPLMEKFKADMRFFHSGLFEPVPKQNDCLFDESKVTLLRAQLQRRANEAEKEGTNYLIDAYVLDDRLEDRNVPNILRNLNEHFIAHPDKIVEKSTVHLMHYDGTKTPTEIAILKGTGTVDNHFKETADNLVREMDEAIKVPGSNIKNAFDYFRPLQSITTMTEEHAKETIKVDTIAESSTSVTKTLSPEEAYLRSLEQKINTTQWGIDNSTSYKIGRFFGVSKSVSISQSSKSVSDEENETDNDTVSIPNKNIPSEADILLNIIKEGLKNGNHTKAVRQIGEKLGSFLGFAKKWALPTLSYQAFEEMKKEWDALFANQQKEQCKPKINDDLISSTTSSFFNFSSK